jgi:Na+-driven multidrug efflux pump
MTSTKKITVQKVFRILREAIRGEQTEFVSGNLNKAIVMLSIPMVLEMVMESLFAVVDIYFVGKVSVNAVATVALTESVIMIVYSIAIGASMAATAMVARRVGEGNKNKASSVAMQSIVILFIISLIFSVAGIWFSKDILYLM